MPPILSLLDNHNEWLASAKHYEMKHSMIPEPLLLLLLALSADGLNVVGRLYIMFDIKWDVNETHPFTVRQRLSGLLFLPLLIAVHLVV